MREQDDLNKSLAGIDNKLTRLREVIDRRKASLAQIQLIKQKYVANPEMRLGRRGLQRLTEDEQHIERIVRELCEEEKRLEARIMGVQMRLVEVAHKPGGHSRPPEASQRRAETVAKIIEELNVLKPQMYGKSDYGVLKGKHPEFLTFQIVEKHSDLELKLVNIQDHRRHIRLAQELAAAHHGRALSTIQTDWKKRKPRKYRRQSR